MTPEEMEAQINALSGRVAVLEQAQAPTQPAQPSGQPSGNPGGIPSGYDLMNPYSTVIQQCPAQQVGKFHFSLSDFAANKPFILRHGPCPGSQDTPIDAQVTNTAGEVVCGPQLKEGIQASMNVPGLPAGDYYYELTPMMTTLLQVQISAVQQ